jgi:hypothetical protein
MTNSRPCIAIERTSNVKGTPWGALDVLVRLLRPVAQFVLRLLELVLTLAPFLLGLALLFPQFVVGELAFLLFQLTLDSVHLFLQNRVMASRHASLERVLRRLEPACEA